MKCENKLRAFDGVFDNIELVIVAIVTNISIRSSVITLKQQQNVHCLARSCYIHDTIEAKLLLHNKSIVLLNAFKLLSSSTTVSCFRKLYFADYEIDHNRFGLVERFFAVTMASPSAKIALETHKNGFVKDSYGYKMSKKVAELTQVGIHKLFCKFTWMSF